MPTEAGSIRWALEGALAGAALWLLAFAPARADESEIESFILALSWQPAFCQYNAGLPECPSEKKASTEKTASLTLHGLWPNGPAGAELSYCGVGTWAQVLDRRHRWCELSEPALSQDTRAILEGIMPARRSCLDRHEWLKHGTCSGLNEATYFEIASALALDAAKSSFAAALQSASGGVASRQALRLAFEESFGPGSARAMSLQCRKDGGRAYLSAVWIRLTAATATLDQGEARLENELLDTSIAAKDRSCPALIYVDPQGL